MSKLLLCLAFLSFNVFGMETLWEVTDGISAPESIYYEPTTGYIFVSNIVGGGDQKNNIGHISLINAQGKVLKKNWVDGLNALKGMRSYLFR